MARQFGVYTRHFLSSNSLKLHSNVLSDWAIMLDERNKLRNVKMNIFFNGFCFIFLMISIIK